MTIAQYNKLTRREQFEYHIKKQLNDICFENDKGEIINLKTDSKTIFQELNKIGIETENKTIDELFDILVLKSNNLKDYYNPDFQETNNKFLFFRKHISFLVLYLVNNDVKKLPEKYKNEIKLFSEYLDFILND
ncbi:hypothetical protein [Flavobacterium sp. U410]